MVNPTTENIDEIIDKLKELQTTIANIKDRPLEFPTCENKDNKSITQKQSRINDASSSISPHSINLPFIIFG